MGFTAIKMRIMPALPDVDLEIIKKQVGGLLEKNDVKHIAFTEEDVAFGLRALVLTFEWPEEKPLDPLEEQIRKNELVSSAEIIDMRRAIG